MIDEYAGRVRRYCRVEITELREAPHDAKRPPRERIEREGAKILKALKPGTFRVAFDERGREMTSEGFAVFLGRAGVSFLPLQNVQRYSHALAGATILACGLAIQFLGL